MVNVTLPKKQRMDVFSQADVPEMLSSQSFRVRSFENERDPILSRTVIPNQADRVVSVPFSTQSSSQPIGRHPWLTPTARGRPFLE